MTKISLLSALALASVCSALELYTQEHYQGGQCFFATPHNECVKVPDSCYGQVKCLSTSFQWECELYDNDICFEQDVMVQVVMRIAGYIFHLNDNYAKSDNLINVLACDPTCIPGTNTSDHN
ncbi:MAG: hypothetical protein J3Q66DRAFT_431618 [Benniella sp.]|nr:MAG: hypothetical protein J3Q66DRAFT_431618 [Benniella sp.]